MEKFLLRAKVEEYEYLEGKYIPKWVEGYLNLVGITETGPKFTFAEPVKGDCISHIRRKNGEETYVYECVEYAVFFKDTVSRWTGLHDKNGKKIFEGDVVLDYYGRQAHVEFFDGRYLPFNAYPEYKCIIPIDCEVIGNRWDNPELVKGP